MMAVMSGAAQIDFATAGADEVAGEAFHEVLRHRRAEGAMVDATLFGMPARLITRYAELDVTTNFTFLRGGSHGEELVAQEGRIRVRQPVPLPGGDLVDPAMGGQDRHRGGTRSRA